VPTPAAPNIPEPVVYGPDFPSFKMLTRHGRTVFESRTNQNLFLNDRSFTENGTYTFGRFLGDVCVSAQELAPLVFTDSWWDDSGELIDWERFSTIPKWTDCPAIQRLLGYCQTEPQRRFLLRYLETQHPYGVGDAWKAWRERGMETARSEGTDWIDPWMFASLLFMTALVEAMLDFPALIPEVWLNVIGSERTLEDADHLAENPQRVDFALFAEGEKAVIEIDGPSHYADYDESTKTYSINEERYAKNLAIERSLRRQGWDIHRFSNLEVERANSEERFVHLAHDLPGFIGTETLGRPAVTADRIDRAMGGMATFLVSLPKG
jgi:hypothetical protein